MVAALYGQLLHAIVNAEFPRRHSATPTRMIDSTPHGVFHGETIDPEVRAVTANIARAGTVPSQVTYDLLNGILDPRLGGQAHFVMAPLPHHPPRAVRPPLRSPPPRGTP